MNEDNQFLEEDTNQRIAFGWSIIALSIIGLKVAYLFVVAVFGFEMLSKASSWIFILFCASHIYLLWYVKSILHTFFRTASGDLPIYISMVLSVCSTSLIIGLSNTEVTEKVALMPYMQLTHVLIELGKIWLLLVLFNLPSHLLGKYLKAFAYLLGLEVLGYLLTTMLYSFITKSPEIYTQWMHTINVFSYVIALLPDLALGVLILNRPEMGVVEAARKLE